MKKFYLLLAASMVALFSYAQSRVPNVTLKDNHTAALLVTNDYGSEDLEAKLEKENDSTYTLKQLEGSPIKIVVDRKWVKLPKVMRFKVKSY